MWGQITKFKPEIGKATGGTGVIATDEGRHYRFIARDVVNLPVSIVGNSVDFVVNDGRATDVIVLCGSPWTVFGTQARSMPASHMHRSGA